MVARIQRGETVVGTSDDYTDAMPKDAKKGPPKSPLAEKVKKLEDEKLEAEEKFSKLQANFIDMQAQMAQMISLMQQQQSASDQPKAKRA